jgi:putative superfamily III holin-X
MSLSSDPRSIPELFGDAIEQLGKLVQNEVQLARAEISEKAAQAVMGAAYVGAAAILCIPVLVLLLMALALWLIQMGFSPVVSHLLAAGVGGLVSVLLAFVGLNRLKAENLTPTVTLRQVKRDVAAAKEMVK